MADPPPVWGNPINRRLLTVGVGGRGITSRNSKLFALGGYVRHGHGPDGRTPAVTLVETCQPRDDAAQIAGVFA